MGYNENIGIHDFRRYFSTILMKNDVPDEVAKELMGHSSIDMTQYYQNVDLETKIEYMKDINI